MWNHGPLAWTFLMFPSSDVVSPGAAVSGFWMLLLLMDALKDGCVPREPGMEELGSSLQSYLLCSTWANSCAAELSVPSQHLSGSGSELLLRIICESPELMRILVKQCYYPTWTHELSAWWEWMLRSWTNGRIWNFHSLFSSWSEAWLKI